MSRAARKVIKMRPKTQVPHKPASTKILSEGQDFDAEFISTPPLQMIDRSSPFWAKPLSWFLTAASALCVLSICLITVFFLDEAVTSRNAFMALVLMGVGIIPVLGILIFEFSHAKALAGYRFFRERASIETKAFIGLASFALLTVVHPFLGLGILVGGLLGYLTIAGSNRSNSREPLWDFKPEEAASVLSGRDATGLKLAMMPQNNHELIGSFFVAIRWLSLIVGFGCASWLAASDVVSPAAIPAIGLITLWSVTSMNAFWLVRRSPNVLSEGLAASITRLRLPPEADAEPFTGGLSVSGLTVMAGSGHNILADVNFQIEPGKVLGLLGPPGSGKTVLMKTLVAPQDMAGLDVRGLVKHGEIDLWDRGVTPRVIPAVFLPQVPNILPTSGRNNLSFFQGGSVLERGKRILEQFVFATDLVDRICDSKDATLLSASEKKVLSFARSFLMSPSLYFIDKPEDGVSEKVISSLVARIRQECRAGRSFLVISENRALLDICDKLLILQEGRVIDFGPAEEIRARQSSGWQRFVGSRSLETEENLESWVRSHFRRDGDEVNRRNACMLAAELLAFSCQNASSMNQQTVCFEFKHFEDYSLLKLLDQDVPLSSGVLKRAQTEALEDDGSTRLSPLAFVCKIASEIDATVEFDRRVIQAKLETYDPRKTGGKAPDGWAEKTQSKKVSEDETGA